MNELRVVVAIACLSLIGCFRIKEVQTTPPPSTAAATTISTSPSEPGIRLGNSSIVIPPERKPLAETAWAMHRKSAFAAEYPVLRRAKPTNDGGYEVRFGRESGMGIIGISYYFDASNHFDRSERWLCDGY